MVIPGDVGEMTEFQEKTMNNSRFILECCLPNVQLVLPSKTFYEKLHNRYGFYKIKLNDRVAIRAQLNKVKYKVCHEKKVRLTLGYPAG